MIWLPVVPIFNKRNKTKKETSIQIIGIIIKRIKQKLDLTLLTRLDLYEIYWPISLITRCTISGLRNRFKNNNIFIY